MAVVLVESMERATVFDDGRRRRVLLFLLALGLGLLRLGVEVFIVLVVDLFFAS